MRCRHLSAKNCKMGDEGFDSSDNVKAIICPWVRSTSTVWPGRAGDFDFSPALRNEAGKLIDRDGNEITAVHEPDGSSHLSGQTVTQMQVESEADSMIRMQLRAKDWQDVIDRILEIVDEQTIDEGCGAPDEQLGAGDSGAEHTLPDTPDVLLNDTLIGILKVLDGKAMRVEAIANAVTGGETTRLYRDGMKTVLETKGLIVMDRRIGWYRPDSPPPERVPPVSKFGAKK